MATTTRQMRSSSVLFGLAALCGCSSVDLDGPWREVDPKLADVLQHELEEARAEQDLPGLAMAIAYHDEHRLWVSATGSASLDPVEDWRPDHRSRIGSVTKLFTTALVYQLVDEGVIDLDDPLEQWVPGWYTGVTVRQLLGHSSGIVSYNYVGDFDTTRPWTPSELVQWAWDHEPTLRFEPGTRWEYSNTNYVLLGLVIEAATGETYEARLQDRLFGPLGLDSVRLSGTGEASDPDLVRCYSEPPHTDLGDLDPSFGWAAGGIVSTPADLARYSDALFFGDVISEESLALMVTPQGLTGPDESDYGLGAFVESDGEYTIMGHTGGMAGYLTYAYTLDEPAVSLVVMSNRLETDMRAASTYGWAAVLGVEHP